MRISDWSSDVCSSDLIWMTFRQARELGGHVRKGERGSLVVYDDRIRRTEIDDASLPARSRSGEGRPSAILLIDRLRTRAARVPSIFAARPAGGHGARADRKRVV